MLLYHFRRLCLPVVVDEVSVRVDQVDDDGVVDDVVVVLVAGAGAEVNPGDKQTLPFQDKRIKSKPHL